MSSRMSGHLLASATILVWSTTYISTKIILRDLPPAAIMFYRFSLAYLVLLAVYPKNVGFGQIRQELGFFCLGLTGIAAYISSRALPCGSPWPPT